MLDVSAIIQTAQQAKLPKTLEVGGVHYTNQDLKIVAPPLPAALHGETLQAVVDYVKHAPDGAKDMYIQILNYRTVCVIGPPTGAKSERPLYLKAQAVERWNNKFQPNQYMPAKNFIIWLMQGFYPGQNTEYLLDLVNSLKAGKLIEAKDNRLTQVVTVKRGTQSSFEEIRNPLPLTPYRTFPEIGPIPQVFLVRAEDARDEEQPPELALVDADAGNYEVTVAAAIKDWLKQQLPEAIIIG